MKRDLLFLCFGKRIVLVDPLLHGHDLELRLRAADDDLFEPRVDDLAAAHGTARRVVQLLARARVAAHKIDGAADHVAPGRRDNGVRLGVDAAAELVALAARDLQLLACAEAEVDAVFRPRGAPL